MKAKGKDLIFISQVLRDGSGTIDVSDRMEGVYQDREFTIVPLSQTYETYIAADFNVFVVKIKKSKRRYYLKNWI